MWDEKKILNHQRHWIKSLKLKIKGVTTVFYSTSVRVTFNTLRDRTTTSFLDYTITAPSWILVSSEMAVEVFFSFGVDDRNNFDSSQFYSNTGHVKYSNGKIDAKTNASTKTRVYKNITYIKGWKRKNQHTLTLHRFLVTCVYTIREC